MAANNRFNRSRGSHGSLNQSWLAAARLIMSLGIAMEQIYWISARDKLGFLASLMRELSGDNAQIILEGDLSNFDFDEIEEYPIAGGYRCDSDTSAISLRLRENTIKPILNQIQPHGAFVKAIRHIQIRVDNEIQLLVGDNFDNECISVGPLVSLELLSKLKDKGIVREVQTNAEAKSKYPWFHA